MPSASVEKRNPFRFRVEATVLILKRKEFTFFAASNNLRNSSIVSSRRECESSGLSRTPSHGSSSNPAFLARTRKNRLRTVFVRRRSEACFPLPTPYSLLNPIGRRFVTGGMRVFTTYLMTFSASAIRPSWSARRRSSSFRNLASCARCMRMDLRTPFAQRRNRTPSGDLTR